jgi:hypothetical protein
LAPELFSFWDILFGTGWAIIIVGIGIFVRLQNSHKPHFKYLLPVLGFKLFFGFVFAITYAIVLEGGGDTIAYWDGAVKLTNLFWEDPVMYFQEMFSVPNIKTIGANFSAKTGYPPSWIYKEPESFFVSKIASIFNLFAFNSYLALTFMFSGLATLGSWRLYETVLNLKITTDFWVLLATLFIPTLAFWCSGISKDTVIVASIFILIYQIFSFIDKQRAWGISTLFYIVIYAYILFKVRPFMLIAVAPPLLIAYGTGVLKKFSDNAAFLLTARVVLIFMMIGFSFAYIANSAALGDLNPDKYLEEVVVIQQDFATNKTYTGYRYDLNITDYSTAGMLRSAPLAIATALFRPFIWEANSAFLLLSGLEGLVLLYLTYVFFFRYGGIFKNIALVRKQEILVFAIIFVLVFGFFVGFSSGLFNVLVRFKAPMMPFLVLFLASVYSRTETTEECPDNPTTDATSY